MRGFDKHLQELLEVHPEAALEHAKLFAASDPHHNNAIVLAGILNNRRRREARELLLGR